MDQIPLTAQKRTVLGRKVKKLRKDGLIPGHVYGHKVKTVHVQVPKQDFETVFEKAGETGIINLAIDGESRPVLIKNVQVHHISDDPLHVDFYQVNLLEKVKVNVPLEIVGEAPAVEKKLGLLLTPLTEIEVESLPADLPDRIEVDVTKLENVGDEIKVKDLPIDRQKVEVETDEELTVAQIGELVTKEMEEMEAEIEAEQAEAAAEAQAEGAAETPAGEAGEGEEGEAKPEEAKEETKEESSKEEPKEG